jgi:sigma-B regulation protein RsbU (phosphoserine phosphatase)
VGWSKKSSFKEAEVSLAQGDVLLAYTDGLTEAMNADREEFGEERLAQAARECRHLHPQSVVTELLSAVDRFAAGEAQHDDVTAVVLRIV